VAWGEAAAAAVAAVAGDCWSSGVVDEAMLEAEEVMLEAEEATEAMLGEEEATVATDAVEPISTRRSRAAWATLADTGDVPSAMKGARASPFSSFTKDRQSMRER